MSGDKKRPPIEAILGVAVPKKSGEGAPEEADDMGKDDDESAGEDAEKAAVSEMFDAIKGDDRAAYGEALRAYLDVCVPKIVDKGDEDDGGEPADDVDGEGDRESLDDVMRGKGKGY